jgi:hypothetical protein
VALLPEIDRILLDPAGRRQELIGRLEKTLGRNVITYVCGDGPFGKARIADDAVPIIHKHLQVLAKRDGTKPNVALYLYARGGSTETPWKITTLIREICDTYDAVIPYKAHSATTMIAMAADKIWMHEMGELGPVDPSMQLMGEGLATEGRRPTNVGRPLPSEIGVEDIAAFLRFIKHRVGLSDQQPLAQLASNLTEYLSPALLGRLERAYSHAHVIAAKLLAQHRPALDQDRMTRIVESLTEKCYVHGHAIRRSEAREIGLDVGDLQDEAADIVWDIYKEYERVMKLDWPADLNCYLDGASGEHVEERIPIAFVESVADSHWLCREIGCEDDSNSSTQCQY